MAPQQWTIEQVDGFRKAAESLKLYRRAELQSDVSDGESLIEELYVDPLPNDHILKTILGPTTTFLIGRKGTGKSTIFQRAQHELRKNKSRASAYLDIKTLYESSQIDPALQEQLAGLTHSLSDAATRDLLLHRSFLSSVIAEIRLEVSKRLASSFYERVKERFTGAIDELFEGLDELLEEARSATFTSVAAVQLRDVKQSSRSTSSKSTSDGIRMDVSEKPRLGIFSKDDTAEARAVSQADEHADILMRVFNINDFIAKLKTLLNDFGIRHLYIFIDDFSELPEDAMRTVVDVLLAPLNNWSEELIKFKVAAYPNRVYLGKIDNTKIDELYLDLFRTGLSDVGSMEDRAIDFTTRLVSHRLTHFCKCSMDAFIHGDVAAVWRLLFYASMANPRILGYVLYYLYEGFLIHGEPIGIRAIREVSKRYYEEKIEPFFTMNKFVHQSYGERASIYSLKELLESIVRRARELREYRDSAMLRDLKGRPPTSHFHIPVEFDSLLATLELNFFISKYYEMSDRDGRKVSVCALNFGLCQKYSIEFGRPSEKREHRLYFVERIFDYTAIVRGYVEQNQEIRCDNCNEAFDFQRLEALRLYEMACPKCKIGTCRVINLSKKYETMLLQVDETLLLPSTELGILNTLHAEGRPMVAREIAVELDCSFQLIGKRGKFLAQRGLVLRGETETGRREFKITENAEKSYFTSTEPNALDISIDSDSQDSGG